MISSDPLTSLFLRLAAVDGISLAERAVADTVTGLLREAGVRVVEDGSAATLGGTAGNLLCFPPHYRPDRPALVLTAHLDTVKSTAALKPVVEPDRIRSDGTTILGADNRVGLSVLVRLLTEVARDASSCGNFFVLFTVGEETGLHGAGTVDLGPYQTSCAYVFDCSKRPGVYIRESVGLSTFTAEFIGKSAHSGVAPEEGISAIQMAAAAISRVPLGRIDADSTTNIGLIRGGEATNAIPESVKIEGEVRSFTLGRMNDLLHTIELVMRGTLNGKGRMIFASAVDFEPYTLDARAPMIVRLERVMRSIGLTPQAIRYTGGSDANKYNAKGVPAVNLGIGAQKPHSTEEFVLIEDLMKSYELAWGLVHEAD